VFPFDIRELGLESAFIVGGGYKYVQLGQGNGFMRIPEACELRPVITGWFSEFTALSQKARGAVQYGAGGDRFAGATYDPTAQYRGARVFDFFDEMGLSPSVLRTTYQHQVGVLIDAFDAASLDPAVIDRDRSVPLQEIGGFLALRSERAGDLHKALRKRDVWTDYRGDVLRFGPAPYLSDVQLRDSITALAESVKAL
jgi:kynureninase